MRHIINGGISSKTIPYYTRDAILLAINDNQLAGISFNIFYTKDHVIVAHQTATVDHGKEKISDLTLHNLQRRNFGDSVRNHPILELKDALNILEKTCKMVVLNIDEEEDSEAFFTDILKLTDLYPNLDIYIKSANMNCIKYLKDSCKRQRIGGNINQKNPTMWKEDLDFFSVCQTACNYDKIKEKVACNRRIMIENVDTVDQFETVNNEMKDISESIYMITDSTSCLVSIIVGTYNKNS